MLSKTVINLIDRDQIKIGVNYNMIIKKSELKFISEKKFKQRDAEKLRGYFANLYKEQALFHNHYDNGESMYRMPMVQYKVIEGDLIVIGFNEGSDLINKEFLKHKEVKIGETTLKNFETKLEIKDEVMKVDDNLYIYRFLSPWLPINQKNKILYTEGKLNLNRVLTNNLLTNFKGLNIEADKKIMVKGRYIKKEVSVKNTKMIGFLGEFTTNVKMPNLISIGKRRAVGFGVVEEM